MASVPWKVSAQAVFQPSPRARPGPAPRPRPPRRGRGPVAPRLIATQPTSSRAWATARGVVQRPQQGQARLAPGPRRGVVAQAPGHDRQGGRGPGPAGRQGRRRRGRRAEARGRAQALGVVPPDVPVPPQAGPHPQALLGRRRRPRRPRAGSATAGPAQVGPLPVEAGSQSSCCGPRSAGLGRAGQAGVVGGVALPGGVEPPRPAPAPPGRRRAPSPASRSAARRHLLLAQQALGEERLQAVQRSSAAGRRPGRRRPPPPPGAARRRRRPGAGRGPAPPG